MNILKSIGFVALALISIFYLLNPTAGVFELLPDNLPFVGNLDEVGAVLLLLKSLQHFGVGFNHEDKRKRDVVNETERSHSRR